MENIKKHKKNIAMFSIVLLVSMLMCLAFFQPHYPQDNYNIDYYGFTQFATDRLLKDGRPFTAMLTILADKLSIALEVCSIISFILSLIFLSASIIIIYNIIEKECLAKSKLAKAMLLSTIFLMIFNYLGIEHIYFFEAYMLILSILLSVLASKIIIENEKHAYTKATLLIIFSAFCYQGSIVVFPMLLITYYILFKKDNIKNVAITTIKIALIYGLAMFLNILFSSLLFTTTRIKMGYVGLDLATIIDAAYNLVITSLNVLPQYVHLGIAILTSIIICFNKKDKIKLLIGYWLIILASILICLMPVITGTGIGLEIRTCYAFGMTIGISLLFMLYTSQNSENKMSNILKIITYVIIGIVFIANLAIYIIITNQHIMVNKLDKANCEIIKQVVEGYEKESNIKITKIAANVKGKGKEYYPGFWQVGDMTQSSLSTGPIRETICYYLGRKLQLTTITFEQYITFFGYKIWDGFSKDQIHIEGDTLYFCAD